MNKTTSVQQPRLHTTILNMAVIVAALGYFVDIYDLLARLKWIGVAVKSVVKAVE